MTGGLAPSGATARLRAVTFDFANTLVPVHGSTFRAVMELTVDAVMAPCRIADRVAFLAAWAEERDRQFREDVPEGREVSLPQRVARVLARQRGMRPPPPEVRWDDAAAEQRSEPAERQLVVDEYTSSFIVAMPEPPGVKDMLMRLHDSGLRLGVLSNWPLSITIERYVAAVGWARLLTAVVVSERVGAIKPSPLMFATAQAELGARPGEILHVGDDWTADVVGARRAGWRAGYLRGVQQDWPRQPVDPDDGVVADFVIERLADAEGEIQRLQTIAGVA